MLQKNISFDIVAKWLTAWSLSRKLPSPVPYESGLMVDVGYEDQKKRYVFTALSDDLIQLSKSIDQPGIFIKVCTSPDELKKSISEKWIVQPQGYMMSCWHKMGIPKRTLQNTYKVEFEQYNATYLVRIVTKEGVLAATGRVVLVDDLAVYDRISTEPTHKRMGLGTLVMKELEKIALANSVYHNFLVATEEGKLFYESLGWELYSLYTSVVIQDKDK
ncbi:GNAT family N-acetyltransferase [Flavobacterium sp.]|uniref:GNAT family N-acetyltransferase n=1 Tax=Flavobacterium sp. TaxID=239 RepID=UPI003D0DEE4D